MSSSTEEEVRSPLPQQISEDSDIIDIEILISSIEERPILWDKTLDTFSDRSKKRTAWRQVFSLMKPGFEDLNQKDQRLIGKLFI